MRVHFSGSEQPHRLKSKSREAPLGQKLGAVVFDSEAECIRRSSARQEPRRPENQLPVTEIGDCTLKSYQRFIFIFANMSQTDVE
jgi:hypothetical protein